MVAQAEQWWVNSVGMEILAYGVLVLNAWETSVRRGR